MSKKLSSAVARVHSTMVFIMPFLQIPYHLLSYFICEILYSCLCCSWQSCVSLDAQHNKAQFCPQTSLKISQSGIRGFDWLLAEWGYSCRVHIWYCPKLRPVTNLLWNQAPLKYFCHLFFFRSLKTRNSHGDIPAVRQMQVQEQSFSFRIGY